MAGCDVDPLLAGCSITSSNDSMPRPATGRRESGGSGSRNRSARKQKRRDSDSDLEDNVLVSMVTTWVKDDDDDDADYNEVHEPVTKKTRRQIDNGRVESRSSAEQPAEPVYSVHLTQIPYAATDMEIRQHFFAKGVSIKSLRMVYDRGVDGRRQFRGVAFCDLTDEASYRLSLSLHKSVLMGRKINVRPTKSKEELTDIVAATSRKVAAKIRKYKDEKDAKEGKDPKGPSPRNRDAAQRRIERKQSQRKK